MKDQKDESELKIGEYHPAAADAMRWFNEWKTKSITRYIQTREAIASTALSGNRLSQICNGTLDRLEKGESVSDRYLLGLCWILRDIELGKKEVLKIAEPFPGGGDNVRKVR